MTNTEELISRTSQKMSEVTEEEILATKPDYAYGQI